MNFIVFQYAGEKHSLAWALSLHKNVTVRMQKEPASLTDVFIPMLRECFSPA